MMKALYALCGMLGAGAVGGCDRIPNTNAALETEARQALDDTLNDSVSARFKDVRATVSPLDQKTAMLCGLVNAKNRMNAYGGWHRFIVERGKAFAVISPDADDSSPQQMQAMQGAFESVYPDDDRCPSSGYVPTGVVADMLKATQKK